MAQYMIPETRIEELRKSIARIQRKGAKYACEIRYEETGEKFVKVFDRDGADLYRPGAKLPFHYERYIAVEAEGTAVISGWEFVASIEHTEHGNVIRTASDIEVPEKYRTTRGYCDHCGTSRERKYTCLVRNLETGEYRQVGRQCLKDYTGGLSAETAAELAQFAETMERAAEPDEDRVYSGPVYYGTRDILLHAAETVRLFGYEKTRGADGSQNMNPTKVRAARYWGICHGMAVSREDEAREDMKRTGYDADREENRKLVDGAIEWLRTCEADSTYMSNLKVLTACTCVREKDLGYIVSVIPTYARHLKDLERREEQAREAEQSAWVGDVGKRITFRIADSRVVSSWETCWGYRPQVTYLYRITDEAGNVFTWKTSSGFLTEEDSGKLLTGTVRNHSEYRGERQTELTRCRVKD